MKIKWLIEEFGKEQTAVHQGLVRALSECDVIDGQSVGCEVIPYIPFGEDKYIHECGEIIIPYGSVNFIHKLQADGLKTLWNDVNAFSWQVFSYHLSQYLLNQRYRIVTFDELLRDKDEIYHTFGVQQTIFVKPCSNDKVFPGQVIYRGSFDFDIENLNQHSVSIDPNMKIVVAPPQNILCEWRFVVVDRSIVEVSQYRSNGQHIEKRGCDDLYAFRMARQIAQETWQPASVYVLDICKTMKNIRMVELGCFHCAGLYACDLKPIVAEVARQAMKEFGHHKVTK